MAARGSGLSALQRHIFAGSGLQGPNWGVLQPGEDSCRRGYLPNFTYDRKFYFGFLSTWEGASAYLGVDGCLQEVLQVGS